MAKQKNVLRARKPRDRSRDDDDSLLLRSAESLGRVIGALQRQLDGATKRLSNTAADVFDQLPSPKKSPKRKSSGAKKGSRKQAPRKRASSKTTRRR